MEETPVVSAGTMAGTLLLLLSTGCSSAYWSADAQREVDALIEQVRGETLGGRESTALRTVDRAEAAPAATAQPTPSARTIGLAAALREAVQHNRDYLSRKESTQLVGLDLTLARFGFGPLLSAAVQPTWIRTEGGPTHSDVLGNLSASQILPTGGNVELTSNVMADDLGKTVQLSLAQPLLRGAGYEVSHEALTQAERNLVYEVRAFELFREDFSIGVAERYFDLVSQRRTLLNEEANHNQAVFDREKAEALFQVGRNKEQDVFRARRREIEANDTLISAQATYRRALDDFKITMGLPTSERIEIADEDPPFQAVRVELASAVEAARHNRLDLMTQRDVVEDSKRAVRNADNGLWPDVSLDLSSTLADLQGDKGDGAWTGAASVNFEIPLQRTPERNRYQAALIALDRAERAYSLELDNLELSIRDQLRQLDSLEQRILLQQEQIEQQKRAVTVSELQYERGELENRDLLDARQSLVDAQNALIQLQADHFIRRLRLLRELGLLFIDENGAWQ